MLATNHVTHSQSQLQQQQHQQHAKLGGSNSLGNTLSKGGKALFGFHKKVKIFGGSENKSKNSDSKKNNTIKIKYNQNNSHDKFKSLESKSTSGHAWFRNIVFFIQKLEYYYSVFRDYSDLALDSMLT